MNIKSFGLFALLVTTSFAAPDYYNFIKSSEGIKYSIYKDSRGSDTVGVGHKIISGDRVKSNYSEKEIQAFFNKDCNAALIIARRQFNNFDSLPDDIKEIIVSICFNLGEGGIKKFVKFKNAIARKDYKRAAKELKDSAWHKQVGVRGKKYVAILNNMG